MKSIVTSLIGPFSPPFNGDGVKNDFLYDGFGEMFDKPILRFDTIYRGQGRLRFMLQFMFILWQSNQIILSLNKNGRILIIPLFVLFKLFTRKKAVLFVIGGSFDQQLSDHHFFFRKLFVCAINRLDGVFAESFKLCEGLKNVGVKNCSVIYNPRKDSGFRWSLTETTRNQLVFVSRVTDSKGIFDLMDAVELIRENQFCQLHIYGHVDPEYEPLFFSRIGQNPYLFIYKGVLSPHEVQQVLSQYHLLALPTFHYGEGLPGVLVEGGFAGIPMVLTRFNSLEEYFKDGESALFVGCRAISELVEKIEKLLSDDELAHRISNGSKQVTSPFHLQRVMNDVKIYLLRKGWILK